MTERSYYILDIEDRTWHAGSGEWSGDLRRAFEYPNLEAAQRGLDDVDCDAIMRHRLVAVHIDPSMLERAWALKARL